VGRLEKSTGPSETQKSKFCNLLALKPGLINNIWLYLRNYTNRNNTEVMIKSVERTQKWWWSQ